MVKFFLEIETESVILFDAVSPYQDNASRFQRPRERELAPLISAV